MKEIEEFLKDQKEFSKKTFGKDYKISSVMSHLRKETKEIEKTPKDVEEWADAFLLLLDGLWRSGFSFSDLFKAAKRKLEKNKKRKWGKPSSDGVIEHKD